MKPLNEHILEKYNPVNSKEYWGWFKCKKCGTLVAKNLDGHVALYFHEVWYKTDPGCSIVTMSEALR